MASLGRTERRMPGDDGWGKAFRAALGHNRNAGRRWVKMMGMTKGTDSVLRQRVRMAAVVAVTLLLHPIHVSADAWFQFPNMPTPRKYFGAASPSAGKFFAVGGETTFLPSLRVYSPVTNMWTSKPSMPTPRMDLAVAVVNDKLYAIGGYNGAYLGTVEMYDPAFDTWVTKAPMPTPRHHLVAAAVGGKIYAIGGFGDNGILGTVEEYDPVANAWTAKADVELFLNTIWIYRNAAAVVGGEIYIVGGKMATPTSSEQLLQVVYRYNPGADVWSAVAMSALPTSRLDLAVAVFNDKIYAFGGDQDEMNPGKAQDATEEFDPASPPWTAKQVMPEARAQCAAVTIGGVMYVMGGQDDSEEPVANLDEYDPVADTWTAKAPMPEKQYGVAADVISGRIYVVGGSVTYVAANEEYDETVGVWTARQPMGTARGGPAVAATPGTGMLYAIGGVGAGVILDVNEEYSSGADSWTTRAPLPVARGYSVAASVGGKVYVIGGLADGWISSTMYEYDPLSDTWIERAPMPTPRFLASAVEVGGKIYVAGGAGILRHGLLGGGGVVNPNAGRCVMLYLDVMEIYDPVANTWTAGAPMPTPRAGAGAASPGNGMVYVVGGLNDSGVSATTERYNPLLDTWDVQAPIELPVAPFSGRHGLVAISPAGSTSVYAFGGERAIAPDCDSSLNWLTTGTLYSEAEWYYRDPATLASVLTVSPNPAGVGGPVTLTLQVANTGDAAAIGVTPDIVVNSGAAAVTPATGPTPATVPSLSPGESASIVWTYGVTAPGGVSWSATASATDAETAAPIIGPAWTTVPLTAAFRVQMSTVMQVVPLPMVPGQVITVSVVATSAAGGATAYGVSQVMTVASGAANVRLLRGPFQLPALNIFPGSSTTYTWTYSVLSSGFSIFSASTSANDIVFGPLVSIATRSTQPSAPVGLVTRQKSASLILSWSPNPAYEGVIVYRIYRGLTPGFLPAGPPVGVTTQAEFTDAGLINGVAYYYRVVAVNADGAGVPSSDAGGTPVQMPGVPGDVRITSTGASPFYANPFLGERIQMLINVPTGSATLKITIYSLAGETVRVLRHGSAPAGTLLEEWDGRNDKGNVVAAAGYLIVLELPDGRRVIRKTAIIK